MTGDLWIDDISLHSLSVKRSDIKLTSVVWIVAYYARMKLPQDSHNLLNSESFAPSPIRGLGAQSTADTDIPSPQSGSHIILLLYSLRSSQEQVRRWILIKQRRFQCTACIKILVISIHWAWCIVCQWRHCQETTRKDDDYLTKLFCCVWWLLTKSIFLCQS